MPLAAHNQRVERLPLAAHGQQVARLLRVERNQLAEHRQLVVLQPVVRAPSALEAKPRAATTVERELAAKAYGARARLPRVQRQPNAMELRRCKHATAQGLGSLVLARRTVTRRTAQEVAAPRAARSPHARQLQQLTQTVTVMAANRALQHRERTATTPKTASTQVRPKFVMP